VKVNAYHLYLKCQELLEGKLKYQEFSDILKKANENQIWFYKVLTKKCLPYVPVINYGIFEKTKNVVSAKIISDFQGSKFNGGSFAIMLFYILCFSKS
jgi:hypothetical protein